MGGSGSSRWGRHQKAELVESTPVLQHSALAEIPFGRACVISWPSLPTLRAIAQRVEGGLLLIFGVRDEPDEIRVTVTKKGLFLCPDCGRRIKNLYFIQRVERFQCRICGGLLYRSSRESRKPPRWPIAWDEMD